MLLAAARKAGDNSPIKADHTRIAIYINFVVQPDFEEGAPTFRQEARAVVRHEDLSGLFPEGQGPVNSRRSH
jgi:hypothetical protein